MFVTLKHHTYFTLRFPKQTLHGMIVQDSKASTAALWNWVYVRWREERMEINWKKYIYSLHLSFFFILFFRAFLIADAVGACEYWVPSGVPALLRVNTNYFNLINFHYLHCVLLGSVLVVVRKQKRSLIRSIWMVVTVCLPACLSIALSYYASVLSTILSDSKARKKGNKSMQMPIRNWSVESRTRLKELPSIKGMNAKSLY